MNVNIATIHCDGAFNHLTKVGSYGVVIRHGKRKTEFSEVMRDASPIKAEIHGAIRAIEVYGPKACRLQVYTDSKVIVDAMNGNLEKWIECKWDRKIVDKELWLRLLSLSKRYTVEFFWVKGHSGVEDNERADALARQAIRESSW